MNKQIKKEKQLSEVNKCDAHHQQFASYLDLYFEIDNGGRFERKLCNKRYDIFFFNVDFSFIPLSTTRLLRDLTI